MSATLRTLKEWVSPASVRHRVVPAMESGLRPNLRLDAAEELLPGERLEPDDVMVTASGELVFTSRAELLTFRDGGARPLVSLPGPITAIANAADGIRAAVEGHGIVAISPMGAVSDVCTAAEVTYCVTDLLTEPDGSLLATVGSRTVPGSEWGRALVTGDRSGAIVRIDGTRADVVAEGLAWPAGICVNDAGEAVMSVSLENRVEARSLASLNRRDRVLVANLPVYPGRVRPCPGGYWVAAPYVRNRVTEMLLDEPDVLREMTATIDPQEWFVPRLRPGNPFTDTMQMGQLRVLGVVKGWAPARSCGLVFRLDDKGRVTESAHARVDSRRHGVTGLAVRDGELVIAVQGYGNLLRLKDGQ